MNQVLSINNNLRTKITVYVVVVSLFLILSPQKADAAVVGYDVITATATNGNYNRLNMSKLTVPAGEEGTVSTGSMYIGGGANATTAYIAVYADSSGVPGSLLEVSDGVNIAASQALGWVNFTFSSPFVITSGQVLWLSHYFDGPGSTDATGGSVGRYTTSLVGDWTTGNDGYRSHANAPVPNPAGTMTTYGAQISYSIYLTTTLSPTISSPTKTSVTSSGATLGGNVTSDGGALITGRGVCVGTSPNPSIGGTCFTTTGTTGTFTVNATGLVQNTLYHYRAYATNSVGTSYTTDDTFTTLGPPIIINPVSSTVTTTGATLGATITSDGGTAIVSRGVCYAPTVTDSTPGFTTATGSIPEAGVTCATTPGTTGPFTLPVSGLTHNTSYTFRGFGRNSTGNGYSTANPFTTLSLAPISVTTNSETSLSSYRATFNGSANPNGAATSGHFRIFVTNPGNCTLDSGGIRLPQFATQDVSVLPTDTTVHSFSYSLPLTSSVFLTPQKQYWYCAYALSSFGTTGASNVVSFSTPDGPSGPCDPPVSGSYTIPAGAACTFKGKFNGVDSGSGSTNTATLSLGAGASLTLNPGQKIAAGIFDIGAGEISIANGQTLPSGRIYAHDFDRDGYIDTRAQYVNATSSAATEFVRRNVLSTNYTYASKLVSPLALIDCSPLSKFAFKKIPNLVMDADHDGYKTETAPAIKCVGDTKVINSRTYYNDGSGPN